MGMSLLGYNPSNTTAADNRADALTPDPTKYHEPGNSGSRGTMIPRAKPGPGGGSQGFTTAPAGLMNIIDTSLMDGGHNPVLARVDMGKMKKKVVQQVVRRAGSMEEAWQMLDVGQPLEKAAEAAQVPQAVAVQLAPPSQNTHAHLNPLKRGYVVPPSSVGGAQLPYDADTIVPPVQQGVPVNAPIVPIMRPAAAPQVAQPQIASPQPVMPQPAQPQVVMAAPQPQPQQQMQPAPQQVVVHSDPMMIQMLQAMTQGLNNLGQLIVQQGQQTRDAALPPPPAANVTSPPIVQKRTSRYADEDDEDEDEREKTEVEMDSFESLKLPKFVTRQPGKPKVVVNFDLGAGGDAQSRYHGVFIHGDNVVLVTDGRWEGHQWLPPFAKTPIFIEVPSLERREFVHSLKCVIPFGCFDLCILPIAAQEEAEPAPEDEEESGPTSPLRETMQNATSLFRR